MLGTGVAIFATHDSADPASVARLVEERGHGSLYPRAHPHTGLP